MALILSTTVEVTLPVGDFGDVRFTVRAQTQAEALRWRYEVGRQSDAIAELERIEALQAEAEALAAEGETGARLRAILAELADVSLKQTATLEKIAAEFGPRIQRAEQVSSGEEVRLPEGVTWAQALLSHSMGLQWLPRFFHAYHAAVAGEQGKSEAR